MSNSKRTIMVVGAGLGVSASVARRWVREGYDVLLVGNEQAAVTELADELESLGATVRSTVCDITDVAAATVALTALAEEAGRVDVLHFNPSAFRQKDPLHLSVDDLLADVALGVGGLLVAVQAVREHLRRGARITVTGSMAADKPWNEAASLGVQKAGVRNLVRSLDTTLAPDDIRAVSVTVCGALAREGAFTPHEVADALYAAAHQAGEWQCEIRYEG